MGGCRRAFESPRTIHKGKNTAIGHARLEEGGSPPEDSPPSRWQTVEIGARAGGLVDNPPVRFRRAPGMLPLPAPVAGGSIEALERFLNTKTKPTFVRAVTWILQALRGKGPSPVEALIGEQGTAKSTFSWCQRALVDPNSVPLRSLPRDDRDLFIAATNSHVLAFDNVSGLQPWLSDALCH